MNYKNYKEYKELNDELNISPQIYFNIEGWAGKTQKEILTDGYKEFLDKHNLTINNYRKIIEIKKNCIYCDKALIKMKKIKSHHHILHDKCWKELKTIQDGLLRTSKIRTEEISKKETKEFKEKYGLKRLL
tara:strand:- start:137 stop:529 length:393 start_codon:yes stop_codon:yes gene_type:complete